MLIIFGIFVPALGGTFFGFIAYYFAGPPNPDTNFIVGFVSSYLIIMAIGIFGYSAIMTSRANKKGR